MHRHTPVMALGAVLLLVSGCSANSSSSSADAPSASGAPSVVETTAGAQQADAEHVGLFSAAGVVCPTASVVSTALGIDVQNSTFNTYGAQPEVQHQCYYAMKGNPMAVGVNLRTDFSHDDFVNARSAKEGTVDLSGVGDEAFSLEIHPIATNTMYMVGARKGSEYVAIDSTYVSGLDKLKTFAIALLG